MIRYNGHLIAKAKELRNNATPQENHLWYDFLRTYPIRFRRQKAIKNYIVDFYCSEANLVIEIDGSQHFGKSDKEYDEERTKNLSEYGIKVLRFSNYEISAAFYEVCSSIDCEVQKRINKSNNNQY